MYVRISPLEILIITAEWRGRLRAAVQEDGLPLLRLGWKFEGHEVRPRLCPFVEAFRDANDIVSSMFIEKALPKFAAQHPEIEITVSPKPQKHPTVIAHYINGLTRPVCLRKCDQNQILNKVEMLRDSTGEMNRKVNKAVRSYNDSVRGVWSPYHGGIKPV